MNAQCFTVRRDGAEINLGPRSVNVLTRSQQLSECFLKMSLLQHTGALGQQGLGQSQSQTRAYFTTR